MEEEQKFWNPELEISYSLEELANEEPDVQIDVMRHWFYSNYENPAEHTPYESAEGGYIYIWGGPFYADEELGDVFGEYFPVKLYLN